MTPASPSFGHGGGTGSLMVEQRVVGGFAKAAMAAKSGAVLKPLLHAYLYDAKYPSTFSVSFRDHSEPRRPDGWFHPSTHPLMADRKLWYYLNEPEAWIPEPLEYMGALSVTMGTAVHSFVQVCLTDLGVMLSEDEMRALGFEVHDGEAELVDATTNQRGHVDGILRCSMPQYPDFDHQLFEFKTSNQRKLWGKEDLDLDDYRATWPQYYAQNQAYMLASGYRMTIVLIMGMGYPWDLYEYHVPYDEAFCHSLKQKYLLVVSADSPPMACCSPGSKQAKICPARTVCPIGSA